MTNCACTTSLNYCTSWLNVSPGWANLPFFSSVLTAEVSQWYSSQGYNRENISYSIAIILINTQTELAPCGPHTGMLEGNRQDMQFVTKHYPLTLINAALFQHLYHHSLGYQKSWATPQLLRHLLYYRSKAENLSTVTVSQIIPDPRVTCIRIHADSPKK